MAYGAFTQRKEMPDAGKIPELLGKSKTYWDSLVQFVTDKYKMKNEWKFYGKNYGWALRYKKYGRAVLSVFPAIDSFTVLIILKSGQVDAVINAGIGGNTLKIIEKTPQIYEGRWIFLTVKDADDLDDIRKIVEIRIKNKK